MSDHVAARVDQSALPVHRTPVDELSELVWTLRERRLCDLERGELTLETFRTSALLQRAKELQRRADDTADFRRAVRRLSLQVGA